MEVLALMLSVQNLDSDLKANVAAYDTKVTDLKSEIETTVSDTIDLSVNVNQRGIFDEIYTIFD
jgi:hypothetical protein